MVTTTNICFACGVEHPLPFLPGMEWHFKTCQDCLDDCDRLPTSLDSGYSDEDRDEEP